MLAGEKWSKTVTVVRSERLFVNWADFPSVVAAADGALVAQWLQKVSEDKDAYQVLAARSRDNGRTWSKPVLVSSDRSPTEHGFVSLQPLEGGTTALTWLDGRKTAAGGAMMLMFASLDARNRVSGETVLDPRVCDCCQTALARTAKGLVAAYRDRTNGEGAGGGPGEDVRDISIVYERNNVWSQPRPLAADGWRINACPVNGPQLDARGDAVAAAWFTMADNRARAFVAFSEDAGETFGKPVPIDDGGAIGRVDVVLLDDGSALVTWIERAAEHAEIRARVVFPDGRRGAALSVSATLPARSSGVPRAARIGDAVYVAYTTPVLETAAPGTLSSVQVARLVRPD